MAYNLASFRELIRATLDLDATDLPDILVDDWIRDGATRAQTRRQQWPFYEKDWTFNSVDDQGTYTLADIQADSGSTDAIAEIRQIRGPDWDLRWQDITTHDKTNPRGSVSSGTPRFWSQWNNSDVILDPVPNNSTDTFVVRGYAKRADWVSDGAAAVSDMPVEFDNTILNWAIGKAHAQQGDPASALHYADMADLRLRELVRYYDDPSPSHEVTFGGDYNRQVGGLSDPRFAWE